MGEVEGRHYGWCKRGEMEGGGFTLSLLLGKDEKGVNFMC